MDRLSILINPASIIENPHIAGTDVETRVICEYVWDGYSIVDICIFHPKLNALAIFNACWFETKFGEKIWSIRWSKWAKYALPYLKEEDIEELVLPPQKLEFLHSPYSFLYENASKLLKH